MEILQQVISLSIIFGISQRSKLLALWIYIILVTVSIYQIVWNYKDRKVKSKKDLEIEILNIEKQWALSWASRSSNFERWIENMRQDYEYQTKSRKRKFIKDLAESFLLK